MDKVELRAVLDMFLDLHMDLGIVFVYKSRSVDDHLAYGLGCLGLTSTLLARQIMVVVLYAPLPITAVAFTSINISGSANCVTPKAVHGGKFSLMNSALTAATLGRSLMAM